MRCLLLGKEINHPVNRSRLLGVDRCEQVWTTLVETKFLRTQGARSGLVQTTHSLAGLPTDARLKFRPQFVENPSCLLSARRLRQLSTNPKPPQPAKMSVRYHDEETIMIFDMEQ